MNRLALLLLALAPTLAHAEDGIPVVIHGAVDATAVRAQLARELGAPITPATSCGARCLEITVVDDKASVTYRGSPGQLRSRIVDLGTDRSQWPLVITLLAGNVVRDEAADVLAGLPAPPPPDEPPPPDVEAPPDVELAPAEPVIVIPPPEITRPPAILLSPMVEEAPIGVGLIPGLSTDGLRLHRRHTVAVHVFAGVTGGSSVLSLAGIADIARGDVSGLQLAGVVAAARSVGGFQIGGTAAVAQRMRGLQIGGTLALADESTGLQIGGIAAIARRGGHYQIAGIAALSESSSSAQIAGIGAVARGSTGLQIGGIGALSGGDAGTQIGGIGVLSRGRAGVQVGGIGAVANGDASLQIGGIATLARGTANVQVAGIVNVAREVRGLQIAPVNIARNVEGVQVGVVNVGGSRDGLSFGLINIVPGGRTDLEATIDSDQIGTVLFRHGSNRWHNVYGVGAQQVEENGGRADDVWMYGFGFGPSWQRASSRIDLELMGWQVNHGARHSTDVSVLGQLRLSYAHQLGGMAIVAGGVLNSYVSNDRMSPLFLEKATPGETMEEDVTVTVWPSAFVGVRL
jgi:hypothetical protein